MCVILLCTKNRPNTKILEKCERTNKDGAGIMWLNENNMGQYKKGIQSHKEVYDLIQNLNFPFVIHFRSASIGGTNKLLCHPFEVTPTSELRLEGECDKLLVHNGHIHSWKLLLAASGLEEPDEIMSDSRAIAMIVSKNNTRFLSKVSSEKGRFVYLGSRIDEDPEETSKRFWYYGDFTEEDGILYSNIYWKYEKGYFQGSGHYCVGLSESEGWQEIPSCHLPIHNNKDFDKLPELYKRKISEQNDKIINFNGLSKKDKKRAKRLAWWIEYLSGEAQKEKNLRIHETPPKDFNSGAGFLI